MQMYSPWIQTIEIPEVDSGDFRKINQNGKHNSANITKETETIPSPYARFKKCIVAAAIIIPKITHEKILSVNNLCCFLTSWESPKVIFSYFVIAKYAMITGIVTIQGTKIKKMILIRAEKKGRKINE